MASDKEALDYAIDVLRMHVGDMSPISPAQVKAYLGDISRLRYPLQVVNRDMPTITVCSLCGTEAKNAPGIGLYCPNLECKNADGPMRRTFAEDTSATPRAHESREAMAADILNRAFFQDFWCCEHHPSCFDNFQNRRTHKCGLCTEPPTWYSHGRMRKPL
jgi:hypothetical protein